MHRTAVPIFASPPPAASRSLRSYSANAIPALAGIGVWLALSLAAFGRGGETGWAQGLVLLAGGIGAAALSASPQPLDRPIRVAALLWFLLIVWCLAQSLHLSALAHPLWAEAASALPAITTASIALDPYAARSDALRLAAYGGLFALGLSLTQTGQSPRALPLIAASIAVFAIAALVLVPEQQGIATGKVRHAADAVFPFTSRNTFCAFAGAGLAICLAVLTAGSAKRWPLWLGIAILCAAGILASHSRAGLAVTVVGCAVTLALTRPPRAALLVILASAAALAALSLFSLTGLRLAQVWQDLPVRLAVWQASAGIAGAHFWLGLGSLDQALQIWPGNWGERHILRAHNIYLQSVAERGFPATIAALAAISLCIRHAWRTRPEQRTPQATVVRAAAIGVLALFASHGLVDFSLYAPLNAGICAILLGLACGKTPPALPRP